MPLMPADGDEKKHLRTLLSNRREELSAPIRQCHGQQIKQRLLALPELYTHQALFVYVSRGAEVDTHALIQHLLEQGRIICVPKLRDKKQMDAVRLHQWDQLVPGSNRILTSPGTQTYREPIEAAIIPGLGFTQQGHRLGLGAGYYDRWLSAHPQVLRLSLAYECQIIEQLPMAPWDQPVQLIVTEQRLIRAA